MTNETKLQLWTVSPVDEHGDPWPWPGDDRAYSTREEAERVARENDTGERGPHLYGMGVFPLEATPAELAEFGMLLAPEAS